jgi:hypothetical protein
MQTQLKQSLNLEKGKVYLFRPEFVNRLRREVKRLHRASRIAGRHQWRIARLVNKEWEWTNEQYEGEIRKEYFYAAISHEINAALPFPICTETGETLRRWCEVAATYSSADTADLENILSFDHFRVARSLSKLDRNEREGNTPMVILRRAAEEGWTVEEMNNHFGDGLEPPNEYDKAIGWLDGLQSLKFDWIPDRGDRERLNKLAGEIREIVEKHYTRRKKIEELGFGQYL